jgi:hypothetical protein
MRSRHLLGLAACLLLSLGASPAAGPASGPPGAMPAPGDVADDEKLLKDHKVATDGPGLLDYLRKRTLDAAAEAQLKELVQQLGDDSFAKREQASERLVALGLRARPALRRALKDPDLEVRRRAAACLVRIEKDAPASLQVGLAVVRVLARRKPEGAAAVLFAYLPSAEDEGLAEEARQALEALARGDGKAIPLLVAGLKDKQAVKRAAAGVVLCRTQALAHLPAVRKLLADPDPAVRLPVALALAATRDKETVPVLIDLLDRLGPKDHGRVLELLYLLAGDKGPALPPAGDDRALRKYHQAWQAWWKESGARLDAAHLGEAARDLGVTVVVLLDRGQVLELDGSNRPRWQFGGLDMPLDVQRLPGDRVLVAEHRANRVTERNRKGEVLWQHKVNGPLMAQRLANGNTFIANQEGLLEVDKGGKQVFSYTRPSGETIMRARKLPNGDIALVTQLGVARFVRLDGAGRQLKGFGVEVTTSGGRIDVTPAGHVLVPEAGNNRVVERDADGKVVRAVRVEQPITATYLPTGHLLITSMGETKRAVEIDRSGKEVWEYRRQTRVTRAVRP